MIYLCDSSCPILTESRTISDICDSQVQLAGTTTTYWPAIAQFSHCLQTILMN